MIRQIQPINQTGYADKQWNLFEKVIDDNITRAQLAGFVRQEKRLKKLEKLKISYGKREVRIVLNHGKLTDDQRVAIKKLIDKKLNDLLKQIDYITG